MSQKIIFIISFALNLIVIFGHPSTLLAIEPFDKQTPTYPREVGDVLKLLNIDRMMFFLKTLTSLPDRSAESDNGVRASEMLADGARTIAKEHRRQNIEVFSIPTGRGYKQDSVLVRVPGQNSTLPGILLGAHMDTFGGFMPGVDDDGTGVATILEIYDAMLDSHIRFQRDVYFAFYAAEERGEYGSEAVVRAFQERHIPLRGVIQFDMTGYHAKEDPEQMFFMSDYTDNALTNFLSQLTIEYLKIPANLIGTTRCNYACSDHVSWTDGGYAAAFPYEANIKHDNHAIHTTRDDLSLISQDQMLRFAYLGAAFLVESADPVAKAPKRPMKHPMKRSR